MGIYVVILLGLIFVYFLLNYVMRLVPEVEAGPIAETKATGFRQVKDNFQSTYRSTDKNGRSAIYRKFIVKGTCMENKGIKEGSLIDVRLFDKEEKKNLAEKLAKEDIVLIYLNDKDFKGYKIRIVKELEDKFALTYYYNGQNPKDSSRPHFYSAILGKVEI